MTDDVVIRVKNVSKEYRLGTITHETFKDDIYNKIMGIKNNNIFKALDNISFDVNRGEILGIIGSNGAGKSTMLKILSRVTSPTKGNIKIGGNVSSLLEVGTGFHPELTGKDNIYLNGSIMGMGKREIDQKLEDIIKFSEIGKFIDTPVKRYSSGMYVRLAFAVAAHLEPDILLLDEVLSVGDAAFQKKCLGKMGEVSQGGKTVIFVSHNTSAVETLCNRCILLDKGSMVYDGKTSGAISKYLYTDSIPSSVVWNDKNTALGNDMVRVHSASICAEKGDRITVSKPIIFTFSYWNLSPGIFLSIDFYVVNDQGLIVFDAVPMFEKNWNGKPFPVGLFKTTCRIPGDLLNDGKYSVHVGCGIDKGIANIKCHNILSFEVHDDPSRRSDWFGKWPGVIRPNFEWNTELIEE